MFYLELKGKPNFKMNIKLNPTNIALFQSKMNKNVFLS